MPLVLCVSLQYDTGTPLTSAPYLLEGGYAMWYLTYGVTCVGSYSRKTQELGVFNSATPPKRELEEVTMEYPSFPEFK